MLVNLTGTHSKGTMKLKDQLKEYGITQKEIAEKAGVSISMVSHVVAGRKVSTKVIAAFKLLMHEKGVS